MSGASGTSGTGATTRGGWVEAGCFAMTLAVLNVSYAIGQQLGVNPIALLFWAMPIGAISLLLVSGMGADWRQVMAHPLSLVIGSGIIAMEGAYYVLIGYVTPTDGSVLVRMGVPIAMLLGFVVLGRRPSRLSALGALVMLGVIVGYVPQLPNAVQVAALVLSVVCGLIIGVRSFAAERHPWNRSAHTIPEKMRVTGLVLLLASGLGVVLVLAAVSAASRGVFAPPPWLPSASQLVHPPALALGLFLGVLVLTVMQYLSFSVVAKLGAENFVATTAFIPVTTLAVQQLAVAAGLLSPIAVDWHVLPPIAGLIVGVVLVIAGGRRPA